MQHTRVLFVGNSYTQYNNLPEMVRALALAAGKPMDTAMVTSGGKTLEWHAKNPESIERIDKANWDVVVLQEQSLRPVQNPAKLCSAAAELVERIRGVGATPMLYLTWARQHIPEMQEALTNAYQRAAHETGARIAPVGPAWQRVLAARPGLVLHDSDRSHPNPAGTYLAACVFFATLFGEAPVGLPATLELADETQVTIDETDAKLLQEQAWKTVQAFATEQS